MEGIVDNGTALAKLQAKIQQHILIIAVANDAQHD